MKKFISILPAVILAALVMTGMDAEAAGTFNTIENGVFIGDIDVSGMTTLEAEDTVNSYGRIEGERDHFKCLKRQYRSRNG